MVFDRGGVGLVDSQSLNSATVIVSVHVAIMALVKAVSIWEDANPGVQALFLYLGLKHKPHVNGGLRHLPIGLNLGNGTNRTRVPMLAW